MDDGGFLVRFIAGDGSVVEKRCASIDLCYDMWTYKTNGCEEQRIPAAAKIEIIVESEEYLNQLAAEEEIREREGN